MRKSAPPDTTKILRAAKRQFGLTELRPGQLETIQHVIGGGSCFAIMPTGSGKSLCFQLPSILLKEATVVVSPLLSLMQDQKDKLDQLGIGVGKIDSTLSTAEKQAEKIAIRGGEHRIIYVTPEQLEKPEQRALLKKIGVGLFVVDEAHCVAQWGHDFRPAYLNLRQAIADFGSPPVLALTATATAETAQEILKELGVRDAKIVNLGIDRPNLELRVDLSVSSAAKMQKLTSFLKEVEGSGLIYCATIKEATKLSDDLAGLGFTVGLYHGRLPAAKRLETQHRFMQGEFKVVVATKAFGMGIDKPDLRFVVHYHFPESLESYYQEIGRAGRDGLPSKCLLLFQLEDRRVHAFFMGGRYPSVDDARKVLEQLALPDKKVADVAALAKVTGISLKRTRVILAWLEKSGAILRKPVLHVKQNFMGEEDLAKFLNAYDSRRGSDRFRLDAMMHYGQSADCRFKLLQSYFEEESGERCGRCDNCLEPLHKRLGIDLRPVEQRT